MGYKIKSNAALLQDNGAAIQFMLKTRLAPSRTRWTGDMDYIRESMESLRQQSAGSLGVFNWKFPDLSELAFSLDRRTEDQIKQLICFYIKALNSRDIARAVLRSSPSILTDAMSTAIDSDEVEVALQRLGHRFEEPIEKART